MQRLAGPRLVSNVEPKLAILNIHVVILGLDLKSKNLIRAFFADEVGRMVRWIYLVNYRVGSDTSRCHYQWYMYLHDKYNFSAFSS